MLYVGGHVGIRVLKSIVALLLDTIEIASSSEDFYLNVSHVYSDKPFIDDLGLSLIDYF